MGGGGIANASLFCWEVSSTSSSWVPSSPSYVLGSLRSSTKFAPDSDILSTIDLWSQAKFVNEVVKMVTPFLRTPRM